MDLSAWSIRRAHIRRTPREAADIHTNLDEAKLERETLTLGAVGLLAPMLLIIVPLVVIGVNTSVHEVAECRVASVSERTGGKPSYREVHFTGCAVPVLDNPVRFGGDYRRNPPHIGDTYNLTVAKSPFGYLKIRDAELSKR